MIQAALRLLAASSSSANVACPASETGTCSTGLPKVNAGSSELHTALSIFFGIAGVISILMIVIGAMMFVTSGGKPEDATKARETIIYAVIGLIVSLSAEVLVTFVLGKL